MTSPRVRLEPVIALPLSLLLLTGCAQGTMGISPGTILSTVIMAGDVINSASRSGSTSSDSRGASRTRSIPRSPAPTPKVARVLDKADDYIGVPYVWGGNTPRGFDCSGFTKYVFASQGIQLPRTSREQARAGRGVAIDFDAMLPGDIMLFAEPGEAISHVAIYVGSGELIHSSSAYHGVNYLDLHTSRADWYLQNLVAVRRLTSNGESLVQSLRSLTIPGLAPDPAGRW